MAAAQTAAAMPPVVALNTGQVVAALNAASAAQGEPSFVLTDRRSGAGTVLCSVRRLCVTLQGPPDQIAAITLTGVIGTRDDSQRYLRAQALLVRLAAPGAPSRPAVTADRLAVDDMRPANAQLGPTCMHVEVRDGAMSTVFSRRRCAAD